MAWYNSAWKKRKLFTIAGTVDNPQTNYQMKLIIHRSAGADAGKDVYVGAGGCKADYSDIRFTKSDGISLLDYWIESFDANTATVWIEFDSIPISPASGTFYIYYGNPAASAYSNGDNTFLWFDDFSTAWNVPVKWTGDIALGSVSGGILTFIGAAGHKAILGNVGGADVAMRCRANLQLANYNGIGLGETPFDPANLDFVDVLAWLGGTNTVWETYKNNNATNFDTDAGGFGAYHIYDISRYVSGTDTVGGAVDNVPVTPGITNVPIVNMYVQVRTYSAVTVLVDWILLRKYTLNEPTWSTWGGEELYGARGTRLMMGVGA